MKQQMSAAEEQADVRSRRSRLRLRLFGMRVAELALRVGTYGVFVLAMLVWVYSNFTHQWLFLSTILPLMIMSPLLAIARRRVSDRVAGMRWHIRVLGILNGFEDRRVRETATAKRREHVNG
jgi:hypothetical protein